MSILIVLNISIDSKPISPAVDLFSHPISPVVLSWHKRKFGAKQIYSSYSKTLKIHTKAHINI